MTDIHNPGTTKKIDVNITIHIHYRRSHSFVKSHGHALRVRDSGSLCVGLKIQVFLGFWTGRGHIDQWRIWEREVLEIHVFSPLVIKSSAESLTLLYMI